jgi:hypothetical protein
VHVAEAAQVLEQARRVEADVAPASHAGLREEAIRRVVGDDRVGDAPRRVIEVAEHDDGHVGGLHPLVEEDAESSGLSGAPDCGEHLADRDGMSADVGVLSLLVIEVHRQLRLQVSDVDVDRVALRGAHDSAEQRTGEGADVDLHAVVGLRRRLLALAQHQLGGEVLDPLVGGDLKALADCEGVLHFLAHGVHRLSRHQGVVVEEARGAEDVVEALRRPELLEAHDVGVEPPDHLREPVDLRLVLFLRVRLVGAIHVLLGKLEVLEVERAESDRAVGHGCGLQGQGFAISPGTLPQTAAGRLGDQGANVARVLNATSIPRFAERGRANQGDARSWIRHTTLLLPPFSRE